MSNFGLLRLKFVENWVFYVKKCQKKKSKLTKKNHWFYLEVFTTDDGQFLVVVGRPRVGDLDDFDVSCFQIGQPATLLVFESRGSISSSAAVLFDRIVRYVAARTEFAIRWRRVRSATTIDQQFNYFIADYYWKGEILGFFKDQFRDETWFFWSKFVKIGYSSLND